MYTFTNLFMYFKIAFFFCKVKYHITVYVEFKIVYNRLISILFLSKLITVTLLWPPLLQTRWCLKQHVVSENSGLPHGERFSDAKLTAGHICGTRRVKQNTYSSLSDVASSILVLFKPQLQLKQLNKRYSYNK